MNKTALNIIRTAVELLASLQPDNEAVGRIKEWTNYTLDFLAFGIDADAAMVAKLEEIHAEMVSISEAGGASREDIINEIDRIDAVTDKLRAMAEEARERQAN